MAIAIALFDKAYLTKFFVAARNSCSIHSLQGLGAQVPFYIRKSVKAGPFRFNFSQGGIGVSVGAKGLRVGTGPRGHYIHAGRHGLYYRASLGSAGQRRQRAVSEPLPAQVTSEIPAVNMIEFESGDVLSLRDENFGELLDEINAKANQWRLSALFGMQAARVTDMLRHSILVPDMSKLLGWSILDCRRLIKLGVFRPIVDRASGISPRYSRTALLASKADLISRSIPLREEMKSVVDSRRYGLDKNELIKAIFEGRLTGFSYTEAERLDDALMFDPRALLETMSDMPLPLNAIQRMLHVDHYAVAWLLDFAAFPRADPERSTVPAVDVIEFQRRFVSSAELKKAHGLALNAKFGHALKMSGVTPAFPVDQVGVVILRREDAHRVLQHI